MSETVDQMVAQIVGALRVMLPPGDATERLVLTVEALPAQARQEVSICVKRCPVCGVVFTGRHPAAVYCSDRCANVDAARRYRARKSATRQA